MSPAGAAADARCGDAEGELGRERRGDESGGAPAVAAVSADALPLRCWGLERAERVGDVLVRGRLRVPALAELARAEPGLDAPVRGADSPSSRDRKPASQVAGSCRRACEESVIAYLLRELGLELGFRDVTDAVGVTWL